MNISVEITTPLESWQGKDWPTKMACRPMLGDCVESLEDDPAQRAVGKIVRITHHMHRTMPYLRVELHHMGRAIVGNFYNQCVGKEGGTP